MRHLHFKIYRYLIASFITVLLITILIFPDLHAFELDVKKYKLENGLTVLHVERHELPLVSLNLLIRAGSKHEPQEKAGLASLVADMLLEGTKTMKAEEISEIIEYYGASITANTDYDYTILSLHVLKKDLPELFRIFKEIVFNPVFPEKELKKKRAILITALIKKEEEPSYLAMKTLRARLFQNHPYGRPVEGIPESIKGIKRKDLIDFYKRLYRPDGSILVVAGDLTQKEVEVLIEDFKNWKGVPRKEQRPVILETQKRFSAPLIINRDLTQANIVYGLFGIRRSDPDYYAASLMNYILGGGGFSSRLVKRIRDEMGLTYDVSSYFTLNEEPGLFAIELQTKNESAITAIKVIKEEIERLRKEPVTDQELEDAKAYLTGSLPRRIDTLKKIADFLSVAEFYGLGDDYLSRYPDYIRSVTKDDIIKVANKLLSTEGLFVIVGREGEIKASQSE
ncbi:MAG: insulinase family protein [Thermodesulfovibrionales bacterium]|nr:insulinase family protein [Thermodesulfovibrionales bacterium]